MEKKQLRPMDYGVKSIETMMRKFKAEDLPPKGRFHYHQGVFLSGVYQVYKLYREESPEAEKYFDYVKAWVDSCVDEQGGIRKYDTGQLDDIQPGILLFPLYERTGDERYHKALEELMGVLREFPKIEEGGYYHKKHYPRQMWLDGLYMAGPISAEYAARFGHPEFFREAYEQVTLMRKKTYDERTGLWYHAYDDARQEPWADEKTGRSPEFWGRSIGWVPVAILDELDHMPKDCDYYEELADIAADLLRAVCKYQAENGLWYQVVDKAGEDGNWPEISCSCLYVAAICKAVRMGILEEDCLHIAKTGYDAVIDSLEWEGEDLLVGGVCVGTGVGDYKHYCERPTSTNDLHGVGAFLIMCAQAQRVWGQND
ncbi:MAG: glycoside hydrolase family 88 protein [Candidatus Gastranaerophilales bacterium]|nr:glycoside hydrolase family 88 protein [Candidatus Gastranaerophilales bacterium]